MKLSTVNSYAVVGVKAMPIQIEVHIANGLPGLAIVGLPEAAVRESKDRVRSALINAGFEYPARRITVNLAPADLPKYGSGFDLAIAIGILHASNQLKFENINSYAFVGELSLSGALRPVAGLLPIAVSCIEDSRKLVLPAANINELGILNTENYLCPENLTELAAHLIGESQLDTTKPEMATESSTLPCLSEVQGQPQAKRALEISASGGHSMLMQGPPGTGKTMLASRLPGILPQISAQDAIEVACIYSVAQQHRKELCTAPFRAPHHTASPVALVGGGSRPVPGEISLAHRGVLFLDELPEFPNKVLEVMRQPLESGEIWISRAASKAVFPARFQLIAAMNPCPCGYHGEVSLSGESRCNCSPDRVARYQNRVSGPIMDRIDLHIRLDKAKQSIRFDSSIKEETSGTIQERVLRSHNRQSTRQGCLNSELPPEKVQKILQDSNELSELAQKAIDRMQLSMRAIHRATRVALTIADMAQTEIQAEHLLEALNYRQLSERV